MGDVETNSGEGTDNIPRGLDSVGENVDIGGTDRTGMEEDVGAGAMDNNPSATGDKSKEGAEATDKPADAPKTAVEGGTGATTPPEGGAGTGTPEGATDSPPETEDETPPDFTTMSDDELEAYFESKGLNDTFIGPILLIFIKAFRAMKDLGLSTGAEASVDPTKDTTSTAPKVEDLFTDYDANAEVAPDEFTKKYASSWLVANYPFGPNKKLNLLPKDYITIQALRDKLRTDYSSYLTETTVYADYEKKNKDVYEGGLIAFRDDNGQETMGYVENQTINYYDPVAGVKKTKALSEIDANNFIAAYELTAQAKTLSATKTPEQAELEALMAEKAKLVSAKEKAEAAVKKAQEDVDLNNKTLSELNDEIANLSKQIDDGENVTENQTKLKSAEDQYAEYNEKRIEKEQKLTKKELELDKANQELDEFYKNNADKLTREDVDEFYQEQYQEMFKQEGLSFLTAFTDNNAEEIWDTIKSGNLLKILKLKDIDSIKEYYQEVEYADWVQKISSGEMDGSTAVCIRKEKAADGSEVEKGYLVVVIGTDIYVGENETDKISRYKEIGPDFPLQEADFKQIIYPTEKFKKDIDKNRKDLKASEENPYVFL